MEGDPVALAVFKEENLSYFFDPEAEVAILSVFL